MNSEEKVLYATKEKGFDLDQLFREHYITVKKVSLRYCNYNNELADEAVQQSYLALMERVNEGAIIDNALAYLATIAKNYTLTEITRHKRVHPQENIVDYSDKVRFGGDVEEHYFEQLGEKKLEEALRRIKEKDEAWHYIAVQVFVNGVSQVQIAEELGISNEAVYARIRRMKAWTNKHLIEYKK